MITFDFLIALPIGGVVGWAIREVVADRLARKRTFDTDFNKAAAEFRCAFTDEIRLVADSTQDTDFEKIFNESYIRHYNALIRFQAYLSESERTVIEKAWKEHCKDYYPDAAKDGFDGPKAISRFMHYEFKQGQEYIGNGKFKITEEKYDAFERAKQLASKNLENILSFAKFK